MRSRTILMLLLACGLSADELLDRIAVVVGNEAITETEVIREARLTVFLNGEPLDLSAPAKRRAAERLVEQELIRADMKARRYPQPDPGAVEKMLREVKSRYHTPDEYQRALREYGITEEELKAHLARQVAAIQFTDRRFLPTLRNNNGETSESSEMVSVDERLDGWLKKTRSRTKVEFREEVFR